MKNLDKFNDLYSRIIIEMKEEEEGGAKYFKMLGHSIENSNTVDHISEIRAKDLEEAIKIWQDKHPDWIRDGSRELNQPTPTTEAENEGIEQLF